MYDYARKTNKMHTFLYNLFHLNWGTAVAQ